MKTTLPMMALLLLVGCGQDNEGPATIGGAGSFDDVGASDAATSGGGSDVGGQQDAADVGGGAGADAGTQDSGMPDAAALDAEIPDAGIPDTGAPDTGTPDTGAPDTGTPDTGALDTGTPDTGAPDTGAPDTGAPDTAAADTGTPDTGASDTGPQDSDTTGSGSQGKCDNSADFNALAKADPTKVIGGCVTSCFTPSNACTTCLQKGLGVSDGCTGCFADIVQCTVAKCALMCLAPSSKTCTDCQKANCFPAFISCSGVSPP